MYFTNEKHLMLERERVGVNDIEQAYKEGLAIEGLLKEIKPDYYRVNIGTLETIHILENGYIDYDFRSYGRMSANGTIDSGYYFRQRGKIDSDRIGRRKLYKTSKGLYFNESGYRNYLKDYIKY